MGASVCSSMPLPIELAPLGVSVSRRVPIGKPLILGALKLEGLFSKTRVAAPVHPLRSTRKGIPKNRRASKFRPDGLGPLDTTNVRALPLARIANTGASPTDEVRILQEDAPATSATRAVSALQPSSFTTIVGRSPGHPQEVIDDMLIVVA
jgi:hypothetical protein